MREEPRYRLRLFLSIDLVGSTAFKEGSSSGNMLQRGKGWDKQIKHFYSDFIRNLKARFAQECVLRKKEANDFKCPQLWKTLGDEIIVCCRIVDNTHLKLCVCAFIAALKDYGLYLDEHCSSLDVKGSGWVCAFPEPNITIAVLNGDTSNLADADQLTDEEIESNADSDPNKFDFLGKHIDAGFRISHFSRPDGFAMTSELAYLLGRCCIDDLDAFEFEYIGMKPVKGVMKDRPYPVVLLNTERSSSKRMNRELEWELLNKRPSRGHKIHDFLESFFKQEGIELPVLPDELVVFQSSEFPRSYRSYIDVWREDNIARLEGAKTELKDTDTTPVGGELATLEEEQANNLHQALEKLLAAIHGLPASDTPPTAATPDAAVPPRRP